MNLDGSAEREEVTAPRAPQKLHIRWDKFILIMNWTGFEEWLGVRLREWVNPQFFPSFRTVLN